MITKFFQGFYLILLTVAVLACDTADKIHYSDGTTGNYRDFNDQWLVINYWAPWCKPCIKEIPELNTLNTSSDKVQVIGVHFDKPAIDQQIADIKKIDIHFPVVLSSPHLHYSYDYPTVLPTTIIITPAGNVDKVLIGPQTAASIQNHFN